MRLWSVRARYPLLAGVPGHLGGAQLSHQQCPRCGLRSGLQRDARTYSDNPCPEAGNDYVGHYDGIVRNNFIFANDAGLLASSSGFDCGICFSSACGAQAVHNTIMSTGDNFSSIEWRFSTSTGVQILNNIASHPLRERDGASGTQDGNLESAQSSLFVDGQNGDLHLTSGASAAIDQGVQIAGGLCDDDIDGEARDSSPDVGADELL